MLCQKLKSLTYRSDLWALVRFFHKNLRPIWLFSRGYRNHKSDTDIQADNFVDMDSPYDSLWSSRRIHSRNQRYYCIQWYIRLYNFKKHFGINGVGKGSWKVQSENEKFFRNWKIYFQTILEFLELQWTVLTSIRTDSDDPFLTPIQLTNFVSNFPTSAQTFQLKIFQLHENKLFLKFPRDKLFFDTQESKFSSTTPVQ